MSKIYFRIVLEVNSILLLWIIFLLLPTGMMNVAIGDVRVPLLVNLSNLMVFVSNLALIIFALIWLRPLDTYAKIGFLVNLVMLVTPFITTLFFTGLQPA